MPQKTVNQKKENYIESIEEAKTISSILARNTKYYRELRGMTQQELANLSGLSRVFISNIETDSASKSEVFFNILTMIKLSRGLSVKPEDLITQKTKKNMRANFEYIIKINNDYNSLFKKQYGALTYYVPETYKGMKDVFPRGGKVHKVPKENILGLKTGDLVILHHHAMNFHLREDLYYLTPNRILGYIRDKELTMLNNMVLVELKESNKSIGQYKKPKEKVYDENVCKVISTYKGSPFKKGQDIGVFSDEIISFRFQNREYYMVYGKQAVPIMYGKNGEIISINGWVMLDPLDEKEIFELGKKGYFLQRNKDTSSMGRVISLPKGYSGDINEGDIAIYEKRNHVKIDINGKTRYFSNIEFYKSIWLLLKK